MKKIRYMHTLWSSNPTPDVYLTEMCACMHQKIYRRTFIATTFNSQKAGTAQIAISSKPIHTLQYIHFVEYTYSNKNKWNTIMLNPQTNHTQAHTHTCTYTHK